MFSILRCFFGKMSPLLVPTFHWDLAVPLFYKWWISRIICESFFFIRNTVILFTRIYILFDIILSDFLIFLHIFYLPKKGICESDWVFKLQGYVRSLKWVKSFLFQHQLYNLVCCQMTSTFEKQFIYVKVEWLMLLLGKSH